MTDLRQLWASAAAPLAGLTAADPAYREAIAPERLEGRGLSDSMIRMWGCGLTWCAIARMMGLGDETGDREIVRTYVVEHAVSDVIAVFARHGAWHATWSGVGAGAPLPGLGDCVIIGAGGYHVRACIVAIDDAGNVEIVEGGHEDAAGNMAIARVKARLVVRDGVLYCGQSQNGATRVYGWGDVTKLPDPGQTDAGTRTEPAPPPDEGQASTTEDPT